MGAGRWIGRGDKIAADQAAVDAMRAMLDTVPMDGVVVIGEGEKDEAPMLYNGEPVGDGTGPEVDVAVDPLEGTRLTALGQPNAIAVIALAERGTMFFPGAAVYMEKIAVGPEGDRRDRHRGVADRERATRSPRRRASRRASSPSSCSSASGTTDLIAELREAGAKVNLIRDGDVAPAIAAAQGGTRRRHALRDRRHARRRHLRRGAEVRRRRHPGEALAARRRGAAAARRRRARPDARAHDRRPRRRRTTSSSRRPASRPARCCAACATDPNGVDHGLDRRCARASGTVRTDRGAAPPREARRRSPGREYR